MLTEESLSSGDVLLVTTDACIFVCVQQLTDTVVVSAVSENVQGDPALTEVVWLADVLFLKEKFQVISTDAEDAFARGSRLLRVNIKSRSSN